MRKFLCLIFCLLSLSAFAQTRPSFLELKDVPSWLSVSEPQVKSVLQFGVTGDGSDEYAELKAAFESGGIITIPGSMTITIDAPAAYTGMTITKDTWIIGNGAKIVQKTPTMGTPYGMVYLQASTNNLNIRIDNLFVDGADAARIGIAVVLDVANSGGILGIHGCKSENMAGGFVDLSTSGIVAYGMFDTITIDGCVVDDIARTASGTPSVVSATGISVSEALGVTTIRNSKVTDITSNAASSWIDADGISVFSRNQITDSDPLHQVTITDNFIQNFSGRGIKTQCPYPFIERNTIRLDSGTTMTNSTFVDLQLGAGKVSHNKFLLSADAIIGGSQAFVTAQQRTTGKRDAEISYNDFVAMASPPYGILYSSAGDKPGLITVDNNTFDGTIYRCVYPSVASTTEKHVINVRGNTSKGTAETTFLVAPAGGFSDPVTAANFTWDIQDNKFIPPISFDSRVMEITAAAPYRGRVLIAGNEGWYGGVSLGDPSMLTVLPGSNFYFEKQTGGEEFDSSIAGASMGFYNFNIQRLQHGAILASETKQVLINIPYQSSAASWTFGTQY